MFRCPHKLHETANGVCSCVVTRGLCNTRTEPGLSTWDFQLSSLNLLSDMKVTSAADEASDTQHETITPDTGQSNLGRDLHSERWNIFRSSREPQKKSMMWHVNPRVKKTEFHLICLSVQSSATKPQCWILNFWPNRRWKSFKSLSEVSSELSGESSYFLRDLASLLSFSAPSVLLIFR